MDIKPLILIVGLIFCLHITSCKQKINRPNILFIAIDDLRPELGAYGNKIIKSPNLDKLALEGVIFNNHFVQVPICGASRYNLLTGMRPINRAQLKNDVIENEISNNVKSLKPESFIEQLKRNGYYTVGIGKIGHSADGLIYKYTEEPSTNRELPNSWDEIVFNSGKWKTGWNAFFGYENGENRQSLNNNVRPFEKGAVNDEGYVDGLTAQLAIEKLEELKHNSKPFFLGVGFFKPHLPFNSPKKYWDLYNEDDIPIATNIGIPKNVNLKSLHNSGEFNQYKKTEEFASLTKPLSTSYSKKLTHAYYASVSYIDAQIGKVLNKLKELDLDKNTIVVVWGDHGWHLGDKLMWGKHTLFDKALKSTLIIKAPHLKINQTTLNTIVETVDIYPSLLQMCDVKMPYKTDGESFVNLLGGENKNNKNVAYSYFKDGISLRTNNYRLTKYYRSEEPTIELYNHLIDPNETINIAKENIQIVNKLMPILEKGNTGLYNIN